MPQSNLRDVVESRRVNALLAWLLVGFLAMMAAVAVIDGDVLGAGFTLALLALAVIPPLAYRTREAMLPWEVLTLASLPVVGRALVVGETIGGVTLTGRLSTYVAVAAVALIVAVELDVFTSVRMNHTFAILFVVVTTTAAAGVWALVQWLSDVLLGTAFLLDGRSEQVVETALMWDFVAATVVGMGAGFLFEFYFRRRSGAAERVSNDVDEAV